jgi:hypothetical protein
MSFEPESTGAQRKAEGRAQATNPAFSMKSTGRFPSSVQSRAMFFMAMDFVTRGSGAERVLLPRFRSSLTICWNGL